MINTEREKYNYFTNLELEVTNSKLFNITATMT